MPFRSRHTPRGAGARRAAQRGGAPLAWIADTVAAARAAIAEGGLDSAGTLSGESLDRLWADALGEATADPNDAINLVGLALGQLLVDRFGLEWVALTDEHGTEIAVRGPSEFTVFPTVHCPPEARHAFVGAGNGPCVLLCASSRQFAFADAGFPQPRSTRHRDGLPPASRSGARSARCGSRRGRARRR